MIGLEEKMISIIVLQTIAANLGSMLTPIGNPQNLYIYGLSGMNMGSLHEATKKGFYPFP